jgi:DNA-binding transcriptional ArsR family regulator
LWEEIDAIVEADISFRSTILADQGLEAAINTVDPRVKFTESRLTFDLPGYDEVTSPGGDGVALVPSVFRCHGLAVNWLSHVPTINYPAIGADLMWANETRSAIGPGMSGLMGRTRATLLADLEQPHSTTALARRHDLAPATVSRHLSVLSTAGLVVSYRRGRWVLYTRTPLAASLMRGDDSARPSSADMAPPDA